MVASKCCRNACIAAWLVLAPRGALAEPAPKTQSELTWLLDSGDLLSRTTQTAAEIPPWEGLASRRNGRDSWLRGALLAQDSGFLPGVTTNALLRFELGLSGLGRGEPTTLRDASSSLAVSWWASRDAALTLRAYPFDTDYLRLGYLHALDWGGTDVARRESVFVAQQGGVPGATLSWRGPRLSLFSGLKWATTSDALAGPKRRWGVLGGGSFELLRPLRLDAGLGYFQRSSGMTAPGEPATFVEGASLRVVWHRGPSEPELAAEPFRPPSVREEPARFAAASPPGYALALEAVTLVTRQRRFEAPESNTLTAAPALAFYASWRRAGFALHGAFSWRSLAFVIRDDPRLATSEALPARAINQGELSGWVGASLGLPGQLTAGLETGARLPAALEVPAAVEGYAQTFIAGGPSGFEALPLGSGRLPLLAGRLSLRWVTSPTLSVSVWGDYWRNANRIDGATSPVGVTPRFAAPDSLSLTGGVQARF